MKFDAIFWTFTKEKLLHTHNSNIVDFVQCIDFLTMNVVNVLNHVLNNLLNISTVYVL